MTTEKQEQPPEQFVNFSIDNWPLFDVLHKLADGAEHLLRDHDCDAHGWEGLSYAVVAAKIHARDLEGRADLATAGDGERVRDLEAAITDALDCKGRMCHHCIDVLVAALEPKGTKA